MGASESGRAAGAATGGHHPHGRVSGARRGLAAGRDGGLRGRGAVVVGSSQDLAGVLLIGAGVVVAFLGLRAVGERPTV